MVHPRLCCLIAFAMAVGSQAAAIARNVVQTNRDSSNDPVLDMPLDSAAHVAERMP